MHVKAFFIIAEIGLVTCYPICAVRFSFFKAMWRQYNLFNETMDPKIIHSCFYLCFQRSAFALLIEVIRVFRSLKNFFWRKYQKILSQKPYVAHPNWDSKNLFMFKFPSKNKEIGTNSLTINNYSGYTHQKTSISSVN